MAGVVEVVGLGGGEQDAVDAPAEQRREPALAPVRKQARIVGQRRLRGRCTACGPGVERGERVDQHDLAVEAGEVVAEERPHHDRPYRPRSAAPSWRRGEPRRDLAVGRESSGAKVSAGEPSRSPGMRKRPGGSVDSA